MPEKSKKKKWFILFFVIILLLILLFLFIFRRANLCDLSGEMNIIAPAYNQHSYNFCKIDLSKATANSNFELTIKTGGGVASTSVDLFPEGVKILSSGYQTNDICNVYDQPKNSTRVTTCTIGKPGIYVLGSEGNWFNSENATSTIIYSLKSIRSPITNNSGRLFSINIGTSTIYASSTVGLFIDEREISKYRKFYFPASFSVDKDSDTVAILDSIRNRIAIFSLIGKYKGEIKLPFAMHPVDFVWFPKNETVVMIFQNKTQIGILKADLVKDFFIKSSSVEDITQILSKSEGDILMTKIWPINFADSSTNSFILSFNGKSTKILTEINSKIIVSGENLELKITESSGIEKSLSGNDLASLQFAGVDKENNTYYLATYLSGRIEGAPSLLVYKLNPAGVVIGQVEVFSSPKMLTNRYLVVDKYGTIFYMKADDQKMISFYEFKI